VLVTSVTRLLRYGMIAARGVTPEAVEAILMRDRLFFVIYGMLAAALLAALLWDALFPDRMDQEIVGVLPVRPRTLAGARLAASAAAALTLAAALSLPAGILYGVAQGLLPGTPPMARMAAAHIVSTMAGAMFVFLTLMMLRGLVAITAGERIAARVAVALQLLTVVLFVEGFLFLPGVLASLGRQMVDGVEGVPANPLVWFAAMYWWLADGASQWLLLTAVAAAATVGTAAMVVALSLGPAAWMGRRALETATRERAGGYMVFARLVVGLTRAAPPVRGMFLFAVASVMRSRRHALVLATYLGLAFATSAVGLISASYSRGLSVTQPSAYLLTVPMVLIFFSVFGLKAALAIPTDVDANWPFRLAPPSARQAIAAARLLLMTLAIVPIAALWLLFTLSLWRPWDALVSAALILLSGVALVELSLGAWTKVPFASAHEPAASTMKTKWFFYVFFLHVFGFLLAFGLLEGLRSGGAALAYAAFFVVITVILRLKHQWELRRQPVTLDAVDADRTLVLDLSEASN
jgi:hypothetical protein